MAEEAAEAGQPEAFAQTTSRGVARAVSFLELGGTSSGPGGRAVSRCLASSKEYEGNPLLLPMAFIHIGDNSTLCVAFAVQPVVQSFRVLRSLKRNRCLVSNCRPEGKRMVSNPSL